MSVYPIVRDIKGLFVALQQDAQKPERVQELTENFCAKMSQVRKLFFPELGDSPSLQPMAKLERLWQAVADRTIDPNTLARKVKRYLERFADDRPQWCVSNLLSTKDLNTFSQTVQHLLSWSRQESKNKAYLKDFHKWTMQKCWRKCIQRGEFSLALQIMKQMHGLQEKDFTFFFTTVANADLAQAFAIVRQLEEERWPFNGFNGYSMNLRSYVYPVLSLNANGRWQDLEEGFSSLWDKERARTCLLQAYLAADRFDAAEKLVFMTEEYALRSEMLSTMVKALISKGHLEHAIALIKKEKDDASSACQILVQFLCDIQIWKDRIEQALGVTIGREGVTQELWQSFCKHAQENAAATIDTAQPQIPACLRYVGKIDAFGIAMRLSLADNIITICPSLRELCVKCGRKQEAVALIQHEIRRALLAFTEKLPWMTERTFHLTYLENTYKLLAELTSIGSFAEVLDCFRMVVHVRKEAFDPNHYIGQAAVWLLMQSENQEATIKELSSLCNLKSYLCDYFPNTLADEASTRFEDIIRIVSKHFPDTLEALLGIGCRHAIRHFDKPSVAKRLVNLAGTIYLVRAVGAVKKIPDDMCRDLAVICFQHGQEDLANTLVGDPAENAQLIASVLVKLVSSVSRDYNWHRNQPFNKHHEKAIQNLMNLIITAERLANGLPEGELRQNTFRQLASHMTPIQEYGRALAYIEQAPLGERANLRWEAAVSILYRFGGYMSAKKYGEAGALFTIMQQMANLAYPDGCNFHDEILATAIMQRADHQSLEDPLKAIEGLRAILQRLAGNNKLSNEQSNLLLRCLLLLLEKDQWEQAVSIAREFRGRANVIPFMHILNNESTLSEKAIATLIVTLPGAARVQLQTLLKNGEQQALWFAEMQTVLQAVCDSETYDRKIATNEIPPFIEPNLALQMTRIQALLNAEPAG